MGISEFISNVKKKSLTIGVIGDSMIDTYHYGKVSRISPEFPVPVLHSSKYSPEYCPGGAANVCYQFYHLNAKAKLFSFVDHEAKSQLSVDTESCIVSDNPIPRKIRFYDNEFPLLRYDIESPSVYPSSLILKEIEKHIENLDVVIMSNYNKGLFNEQLTKQIISLCEEANIPTIVDPKSNPEMWKRCTIFKPNSSEAYHMTGKKDWKDQCRILKNITKCNSVIITKQGLGVVGLQEDFFEYQPKKIERNVSSVIGAGDCFIAFLALGIGHNHSIQESIKYAFEAGAQYVTERHNRPVTLYEMHRRIDPVNAKIMNIDEIVSLKQSVFSDLKWVFTNGCFDLLHSGHLSTLQEARLRGDKVVVGINTDESVSKLKGSLRPIQPLSERQRVIAAMEYVDFVVSFDEDTPYEIVKKLKPNILVKGAQYKNEDVVGADMVENVVFADHVAGNSTTNIIEKIKNV